MPEGSMGHDAMMDSLIESAGMTEDTWVTADGKHIKYEDLTDSHLSNILRYLHRCVCEMHPGPTGDAAHDAWAYEMSGLECKIEDLQSERKRRENE